MGKSQKQKDSKPKSEAATRYPKSIAMSPTKSPFSFSMRDLVGFLAVGLNAYQSSHIAVIESTLHVQEVRISELERLLLSNSSVLMNTNIATAIPASGNLSILEQKSDDLEYVEDGVHAPHSHYAITMVDGVPLNPDKEYGMADFESIFHVVPLWEVVESEDATPWLNQNNVRDEPYYSTMYHEFAPLLPKVKAFFENREHKDDDKLYVKWESKETWFGLYAREPFASGDIVGLYTGVLYTIWEDQNEVFDTDYNSYYPSDTGNYPSGLSFQLDGRER